MDVDRDIRMGRGYKPYGTTEQLKEFRMSRENMTYGSYDVYKEKWR